MKKLILLITVACLVAPAQANPTAYTPLCDPNLLDLFPARHVNRHLPVPTVKKTRRAVLAYNGINDATYAESKKRAAQLLEDMDSGATDSDVRNGYYAGNGTDGFGQGILPGGNHDSSGGHTGNLDVIHQPSGGTSPTDELVIHPITPPQTLIVDDTSGVTPGGDDFGTGIDPGSSPLADGGVSSPDVPSVTVPVPGAVLLGGIGVSLVGWLRRKRTL